MSAAARDVDAPPAARSGPRSSGPWRSAGYTSTRTGSPTSSAASRSASPTCSRRSASSDPSPGGMTCTTSPPRRLPPSRPPPPERRLQLADELALGLGDDAEDTRLVARPRRVDDQAVDAQVGEAAGGVAVEERPAALGCGRHADLDVLEAAA